MAPVFSQRCNHPELREFMGYFATVLAAAAPPEILPVRQAGTLLAASVRPKSLQKSLLFG